MPAWTYAAIDWTRAAAAPAVLWTDAVRALGDRLDLPPTRAAGVLAGIHADLWRRWPRPAFGIAATADGRPIHETTRALHAFCTLRSFAAAGQRDRPRPAALLVAPLSGNYPTLLRDTVAALVEDHDVHLTDWHCASQVPLAAGAFGLDDQVHVVMAALRAVREAAGDAPAPPAGAAHLIAVCQPGVAALAAAALLAQARSAAAPASITLLGSPIDPHRNPTAPSRLARERSLAWFERTLLSVVPPGRAGVGRRVYPGYMQHLAFVMMKPHFHLDRHLAAVAAAWRGERDAVAHHDAFYAEFRATLDLTDTFYLDTIARVFQRAELARGTMVVGGERVEPGQIRAPLLVVEGADDDITAPGQAAAALELCTGVDGGRKQAYLQPGVGHMGLFSGQRWRTGVLPRLRDHIARAEAEALAARVVHARGEP